MKLHGDLASPFVARVVLFARLKGLDLVAAVPEGGTKSERFLAMNPIGRMPVLELDDRALPESEVICEYLEDVRRDKAGHPADAQLRATSRLVSRLHDLYVIPSVFVLFRNSKVAQRDEAVIETAKQGLAAAYGYIEHFMDANPYAAGSAPSLADCTLLPSFEIMRRTLFPEFGIDDPTAGPGKLGEWWRTVATGPITGPFLTEYAAAVDVLLQSLARAR